MTIDDELYFHTSNKPKISVVTCFNDFDIMNANLLKSLKHQHNTNFEFIAIDNRHARFSSIPAALNYGGLKAKGDYIIFVHQDVYLYGSNWLDLAISFLESLPDVGAAGVVGVGYNGMYAGFILDRGKYCGKVWNQPIRVQSLDEQVIILSRNVFARTKFDQNFDFHLYGVDYCLSVQSLGLSVYVLPLFVEHNSLTIKTLRASNIENLEQKLIIKHSKNFRYIYKTTGDIGRGAKISGRVFASFYSYLLTFISSNFLKIWKVTLDKKTILEIGCLPVEQNIIKERLKKKIYSVGVSNKKRYLVISKKLSVHNDYILADPEKLPLRPNSFDIAYIPNLLEHLSKEKGEIVLEACEKASRMSLVKVYCSNNQIDLTQLVLDGEFVLRCPIGKKKILMLNNTKRFLCHLN